MKTLIFMHYEMYEGGEPFDEGLMVPDDFDIDEEIDIWRGANKYATKAGKQTMRFNLWLKEKYESIDIAVLDDDEVKKIDREFFPEIAKKTTGKIIRLG